jgi:hypothetical protein
MTDTCLFYTVCLESRRALRLRYIDLVVITKVYCGHHFQHLLVHSDFPKADLQEVFANKIKRAQVCIDPRGHHFQQIL